MLGTQSFAYDSFKMEAIKNCKDNFWSQMDESEKHLENFVKKLKELNLTHIWFWTFLIIFSYILVPIPRNQSSWKLTKPFLGLEAKRPWEWSTTSIGVGWTLTDRICLWFLGYIPFPFIVFSAKSKGENSTLTLLEAILCVLAHCSKSARLKSSIFSLRFRLFFWGHISQKGLGPMVNKKLGGAFSGSFLGPRYLTSLSLSIRKGDKGERGR